MTQEIETSAARCAGRPASTRRARRTLQARGRTVVAAGLVVAVAASCSSGHKKAAATTVPTTLPPTTPAPTTTTTTAPPAVFPLTGLPAGNSPQVHAPAVVVKIDNVDAARPQTGINSADIVYEVEVEGGLSRLAAVFQSNYPHLVGPVRSGRLTDEGVADDLGHPVLVFSGTNGMFIGPLTAQPVTVVDDDNHPTLFTRIGSNAPHNLFSNVAALASFSTTHNPPPALFHYLNAGQAFTGTGVGEAAGVSFSFPAASVTWAYTPSSQEYVRGQNGTADMTANQGQVSAKTIVLYFCNYVTSGYATGEGLAPAPIPEGIQTGTGSAWFITDGRIVHGSWTRPSLTTPATFKDASGNPIAIPPGRTWVELLPTGTPVGVVP